MGDQQRKKPKNYYVDYSQKSRHGRGHYNSSNSGNNSKYKDTPDLVVGQKGFLVTSISGYEVKCYMEMRQLLEDYYQYLYTSQSKPDSYGTAETTTENPSGTGAIGKNDTDDDLESELTELRQANRHFRQVKTHCKNVIFIKLNEECQNIDQDVIVQRLFEDIKEKKEQKTKYTFKIFPITTTFKTSVTGAKDAVKSIMNEMFSVDSRHAYSKKDVRYFIEIQVRGSYKMDQDQRMKIIEGVAETITELKPSWKVDRDNADLMLVIIALKELCCATFLMDYFKLQKYNILEYYKKHLDDFVDLSCETTKKTEQ